MSGSMRRLHAQAVGAGKPIASINTCIAQHPCAVTEVVARTPYWRVEA